MGSLHGGGRMSGGDDDLDAEVQRWKKQADKSERDCRELQAKLKDTESLSDILHGRLKMVEEREAASKERIETLATDVKTARDKERAANNAKREVESIAESLRERVRLLEERAETER